MVARLQAGQIIIKLTMFPSILKPIFHCDAKLLALGNFALPNAKDSTFVLPNARNTNMLVSLWVTQIFRVLPDAKPKAYIPLRRKIPGGWRRAMPRCQNFALEIPICWYPGANANL